MGGSHLGWNAWTGDARVYTKSPTAPAMSSNEDRSRKPEPEGTDHRVPHRMTATVTSQRVPNGA